MYTPLLVVTPSPSFGESIRASLEETETYRVFVVSNKVPAIVRAEEEACRMAFLDLDLGEQWVEDIGRALRTVVPNMKLFILAGDETPPAFDSIRPWTLIRKPFHLPEVLSTLARPDTTPARRKPDTSPFGQLPWLTDVGTAARHLTRLTLESSAQAALITRSNQVWAYAGELSQPAAEEVAGVMTRNWDSETDGDLLRFTRLETTRAEHILYATRIGKSMLLGLVFDAETPFGTIRSQAGKLASLIERQKDEDEPEVLTTAPLHWTSVAPPPPPPRVNEVEEEEEEVPVPAISEILRDIPQPDVAPPVAAAPEPVVPQAQPVAHPPEPVAPQPEPAATIPQPIAAAPEEVIPAPEAAAQAPRAAMPQPTVAQEPEAPKTIIPAPAIAPESQSLAETVVSKPAEPARRPAVTRPEVPGVPAMAGEAEATLPHSLVGFAGPGADARRISLEPVHAGVYHLTYACLLLPRFPDDFLTGDVADKLSEWMPIICVAFGWRLEFLAVRPEYLQWVANVPPATSPGYVMRIMRQQTSQKLFSAFPSLKKDNPSGDFWAPGYLIMGGTQPHPSQLVKDYIKQVRRRQGSDKPRR
jgi:REP element-mobilizing transposase RayT